MHEPSDTDSDAANRPGSRTNTRTDGGVAVEDTRGNSRADTASAGGLTPPSNATDELERLRDERDFWRGLFEQTIEEHPHIGWVIDSSERIAYCNDGVAEMHGLPVHEMVGRDIDEILARQGAEGMETFAQTVMREGAPRSESEPRCIPVRDSEMWLRSTGIPLRNQAGDIVAGLETTADVTGLVGQQKAITEAQRQVSDEVSTSVTRAMETTERVGDAIGRAGTLASEQAESMDNVAADVSSLSATVEEIAASVDDINQRSDETRKLASDSSDSGEHAVERMEHVADSGDKAAERTRELATQISQVDDMVEIINDIAAQTNILALNANIEAARAGSEGDGFAVVANEVKSLATQVSDESDRIEETLEQTRMGAAETVESIESVTEEIRASAEAVQVVVDNQAEIAEAAAETSGDMNEIAEATDDQAIRTEAVSSMVENVNERAREVASEVDTATEANEEQTILVDEIAAAIERLEQTVSHIQTT